jgi:hypothetical protein
MIGPTVDPQTRSALVYVDLAPLPGLLPVRAPACSRAASSTWAPRPLSRVPQAAVVVRDGFSYVYRVNPDSRISQVKVQTGRLMGDQLEIVSGLSADARVVAAGAGFLNDGDLVRLVDAPAPAPGAKP